MDEISKKPYESFPIFVDFSSDLDTGEFATVATAASVNTSTMTDTSANIIPSQPVIDASKPLVKVVIQNGGIGETHRVTVRCTTNFSNIFEKDIFVKVCDGSEGSFTRQPQEKFTVAYDFSNNLESGDPITSVTITAKNAADGADATANVIGGYLILSPKVNVGVKDGTEGTYRITIQALTQAGYKYQGDLTMMVRDI